MSDNVKHLTGPLRQVLSPTPAELVLVTGQLRQRLLELKVESAQTIRDN